MRRSALVASALLLCSVSLAAQDAPATPPPPPPARASDVGTIDSIMVALYDVISGPVGQERQWDRMFSLFHPAARLIPTGCNPEGRCGAQILTPHDYRMRADSLLRAVGFHEKEVAKSVQRFGNIAHVWTQYESYRFDEKTPFMRGINSVQLLWDGTRWWILQVFWDNERPGNPLPAAEGASNPHE